jgi:molybdenum cofactor biosynthesis enzyme MoaA
MTLYFRLDKTARSGVYATARYCNLSCIWCHSDYFTHSGFWSITNSDFVNIVKRILSATGEKDAVVRFAGCGDPTVCGCDDLVNLISLLRTLPEIKFIKMTTNGILLEEMIDKLHGIDSITISLSAMNATTYYEYAAVDGLAKVLSSIDRVFRAGIPLKINSVYWKGNVHDIDLYEELSLNYKGMPIKFFEILTQSDKDKELFVPLATLEEYLSSRSVEVRISNWPYKKRIYKLKSGAVFEIKISGDDNNCPNLNCQVRSICLEGCRHSVRIGLDGTMHPCGVRSDNLVNIMNVDVTDEQIRDALKSGGKIGWMTDSG